MNEEGLRLQRVRELLIGAVESAPIGAHVTWRGVRLDKPAADFEMELGEHAYSVQVTEEW
jgi:hypothetical protein